MGRQRKQQVPFWVDARRWLGAETDPTTSRYQAPPRTSYTHAYVYVHTNAYAHVYTHVYTMLTHVSM